MSKNIINPFNKGDIMAKRSLLIYGAAVFVLIAVGGLVWYFNRSSADMMKRTGIKGMVTNSDNLPVAGANVYAMWVEGESSEGATTDAQGNYEIMNLQPGDYDVNAIFAAGGERAEPQVVTVTEGTVITVNFKLKKSEPMGIKGQVKDTDGNPIAGAIIRVFPVSIAVKESRSMVSGYYEVLFMSCGDENLDVAVNAAGYETGYVNDISLKCKEIKTVNITLENAATPGQSGGQSGGSGANPGGGRP